MAMFRAFCVAVLCLSLQGGCKYFKTPPLLQAELPENAGPEIYRQGYKDGCQSGFGAYAIAAYKPRNPWIQDPVLAENKVYYQIWKDAYAYCSMFGLMAATHGWGNFR